MTQRVPSLVVLVCLLCLRSVTLGDEPATVRWPPKLLLNSDCGTPVFYKFDAPMSQDQLCHVLNDLPGTQVQAFLPCPQFSDDQFWFPTRVAEPYDGRHVKNGKFEDKNFKRVADNVRSLSKRGMDPMQIWQRQSRKHGLLFIPSLRMNDIHKDYVDRWPSLRSNWERARKHLLIGKAIPAWYTAPYKYTWSMDYAHAEVRKRKLDIISEICSRYDVDGFEMDFLRHTLYFRRGEEAKGARRMNEFVRSVRQRLTEIGKKKGKRLRLLVRVPPQLSECRQIGLDVPTWIGKNWIDMVIAMAPGYLDMDADVASFVKLCRETPCVVAGGLEYYVRGYEKPKQRGITWASLEMLRAGAASIWAQGASSVYLFNYDCHGPFPFRGKKRQALEEIGDPAKLIGKNKRYLITIDMNNRTAKKGGNKQLPVTLDGKKKKRTIQFFIADDLAKARQDRSLKSLEMTILAQGAANLRIRINGSAVKPSTQTSSRLVFQAPQVVQGKNRLDIEFNNGSPRAKSRVTGIDVWVRYR